MKFEAPEEANSCGRTEGLTQNSKKKKKKKKNGTPQ
jgi:hypothetical protein